MALAEYTLLSIHLSAVSTVALPEKYADAARDNASRTVSLDDLNLNEQLAAAAGADPAPAEVLSRDLTFDGTGFVEFDLTDAEIVGAVDGNGEPVTKEDMTGKKGMLIYLSTCRGDGTLNSGPVIIKPGASNGYSLFGAGNEVELPPETFLCLYTKSGDLPVISATERILRLEGAAGDQVRIKLVLQN
jgi:hypothetical protein